MAHIKHKLTPAFVERKSKIPGSYGDGGGLYLYVSSKTSASWVFCYRLKGKDREMGLGPYPQIPLERDPKAADATDGAREMAAHWRSVKARGLDPIEIRESQRAAKRLQDAKAITFKECAASYIAAHRDGWKNAKHGAQWSATLETYAYPVFGDLSVADVDAALVHKVLDPIWTKKTETASRVRGRIEAVLEFAKTRGYRTGENPARWKGHLEHSFPDRAKVQKVKHHAALPWKELPAFMQKLQAEDGLGAMALRLAILTAVRTGEVIGATWSEIDLDGEVWTIPAERTKMGREHRVPLSEPALAILKDQHKATGGKGFVFPGMNPKHSLSNMAMLMTLRRMERDDLTAHGFRSTFRDWAEEQTAFHGSVAEAALGHVVGDKVEAAYRRGDLFEKRRKLMDAWATFATTPKATADNVRPIRQAATA